MADELDPKRQNEELAEAAKEDVRDQVEEEFEDIDENDADEDETAEDVEE